MTNFNLFLDQFPGSRLGGGSGEDRKRKGKRHLQCVLRDSLRTLRPRIWRAGVSAKKIVTRNLQAVNPKVPTNYFNKTV